MMRGLGKPRAAGRADAELFLNRELSWLEFNDRVLEEARDPSVPLLERLKFAVIAASNLDEFFMVRVATLRHDVEEGAAGTGPCGLTPAEQLARISKRAHALVADLASVLRDEILPALEPRGVRVLAVADLSPAQRSAVQRFFREDVFPTLTPLAMTGRARSRCWPT